MVVGEGEGGGLRMLVKELIIDFFTQSFRRDKEIAMGMRMERLHAIDGITIWMIEEHERI